jgi:hypothetical protein
LALFGRRPPERVVSIVGAGVRKPAHNLPPALQKKIGVHRAGWTGIRCALRNQNDTLTHGRADYLDRELPKNGDVPRSPLPKKWQPDAVGGHDFQI